MTGAEMRHIVFVTIPFFLLLASGCNSSNKAAYETFQNEQQSECSQIRHDRARTECMEGISTPYDTYRIEWENSQGR